MWRAALADFTNRARSRKEADLGSVTADLPYLPMGLGMLHANQKLPLGDDLLDSFLDDLFHCIFDCVLYRDFDRLLDFLWIKMNVSCALHHLLDRIFYNGCE